MQNSSLRLSELTLSLSEHCPVVGLYISSHLLKEDASLMMAVQDTYIEVYQKVTRNHLIAKSL